MNLRRRFSGQTTSAHHSARPRQLFPLLAPSHSPAPSNQLVTDGALRKPGIGATLYVTRNDKLRLAGFFSAKLRGSQLTWLSCEVEALAIAVATKHFSPHLIQSHHKACILTDSKPCIQAYQKLCRGEFSASPCVSTFLSTVSHYQASVRHVSGSAILPSDFASRNAAPCENEACQDSPKILLLDARQSKTYSVAMDTSRSPVVWHGWPHSRNVPTYHAHTCIYNRERVLLKNSPT